MIPEFKEIEIIEKAWGQEWVIINNDLICGKILYYNKAGSVSSFHMHPIKREAFRCVWGSFKFRWKDEKGYTKERLLKMGDIVYLPPNTPHQLESMEDSSQIWEISTHHDDKDVIRIEPGDSQREILKN